MSILTYMTLGIIQLAEGLVDHELQCGVPDQQVSVGTRDAFVFLLRVLQLRRRNMKSLGCDQCLEDYLLLCNKLMQSAPMRVCKRRM